MSKQYLSSLHVWIFHRACVTVFSNRVAVDLGIWGLVSQLVPMSELAHQDVASIEHTLLLVFVFSMCVLKENEQGWRIGRLAFFTLSYNEISKSSWKSCEWIFLCLSCCRLLHRLVNIMDKYGALCFDLILYFSFQLLYSNEVMPTTFMLVFINPLTKELEVTGSDEGKDFAQKNPKILTQFEYYATMRGMHFYLCQITKFTYKLYKNELNSSFLKV